MNPYLQYMYSYPHKTAYRSLSGVFLKDYAERLAGGGHTIYFHIPFCQSKCGYCNLFSVTGQTSEAMERYLDGMERQMRQYQSILVPYQTRFSDLVIGGGTPLIMSETLLDRMFAMAAKYGFLGEQERIIETAPNQTTWEKLRLLQDAKVTRISIGVQSFSDQELTVLGRRHSAKKAREALGLLKTFDFSCLNMDLIYGIPGQGIPSLLASLKEALTFFPDEIFLYPLYVKHGVKMEQDLKEGMVLNPDLAFSQYQEASAFLRASGFRQDSMRRFVRQISGDPKSIGRQFNDCGFGTSLSIGCGGRSYLGNLHFCTPYAITQERCRRQIQEYEETKDDTEIKHGIFLTPEEIKRRYIIRHLLILPGLPIEQYKKKFQTQAIEDFPLLARWTQEGLLDYHQENGETFLALTEEGMGLSDYLGPQLISEEVRRKMEEWDAFYGS